MAAAGADHLLPTSSFFLGSATDYAASTAAGMLCRPGRDVGGGTSFSLIRTLGRAYEASQLRGAPVGHARLVPGHLGSARPLPRRPHRQLPARPRSRLHGTGLDRRQNWLQRMDLTRTLAEGCSLMITG